TLTQPSQPHPISNPNADDTNDAPYPLRIRPAPRRHPWTRRHKPNRKSHQFGTNSATPAAQLSALASFDDGEEFRRGLSLSNIPASPVADAAKSNFYRRAGIP